MRPLIAAALFTLASVTPAVAQVVLTGTVRDAEGAPLPGQVVHVYSNADVHPAAIVRSAHTDAEGRFTLDSLRLGRIEVGLSGLGDTRTVRVFTDRPGPLAVDLARPAGGRPLTAAYPDPSARAARFARLFEGEETDLDASDEAAFREAARLARLPALPADESRALLAALPPDSPLWTATDNFAVLRAVDATGTPGAYADYLDRYVAEQRQRETLHGVLHALIGRAERRGETARRDRLLALVRSEFAGTYWGAIALAEFASDRSVRPGVLVPAFAFPRLDDTTAVVKPSTLEGRVYLLDFWATWCAPCLTERSILQDLYARYAERGFTIVSVSYDVERDRLAAFLARPSRAMPWYHVHLPHGSPEAEAVRAAFGIQSLPKLVLVGADGRVLAGGAGLDAERLDALVAEVFD